jgi:hypothetical protein
MALLQGFLGVSSVFHCNTSLLKLRASSRSRRLASCKLRKFMGFKFLTVVAMGNSIVRDITLCGALRSQHTFRRNISRLSSGSKIRPSKIPSWKQLANRALSSAFTPVSCLVRAFHLLSRWYIGRFLLATCFHAGILVSFCLPPAFTLVSCSVSACHLLSRCYISRFLLATCFHDRIFLVSACHLLSWWYIGRVLLAACFHAIISVGFCLLPAFTLLYWSVSACHLLSRWYIGRFLLAYRCDAGIFLGLFFDPEDGDDIFPRNVGWLSTDHTALFHRRWQ